MEEKHDVIKSVTDIVQGLLTYASGNNPQNRDFFEEMDNDPGFQKSYQQLKNFQQENRLSDNEVIQAQLINMMLEEDFFYQGHGEYRYFDEESFRSSNVLRSAGKSEGPAMIKAHRRLQLNAFGRKSSKEEPGLAITHKDPEHKSTDEEIKKMYEVADILANSFFFLNGETNANLGKVLGAAYEDWFDLDKICLFIWRSKKGDPLGMILMDAVCVKHIMPGRYVPIRWDSDEIKELSAEVGAENSNIYQDEYRYLIVNRHRSRVAKVKGNSMIVSHFFKRTAMEDAFKGCSIIEQATRIVTSIINSLELNSSRMTNNRVPVGILALQGASNINQMQLERFKKLLWSQNMGPQNRWKVPVIGLPEKNQLQWIPFHESNKDMEFFNWMSLMFTILCRLSGTDPEELSLASNRGTMQNKGSLFTQGQEGITRRSQDTGLRTFLSYIEELINDSGIVRELTGQKEWIVKFKGLDKKDEKEKEDLYQKQLGNHTTINEILNKEGKKPYKLMLGDMNIYDIPGIHNQNVFQLVLQAIQQKQQEEMMEEQQQAQMGAEGQMGEEGMEQGGQPGQLPEMTADDAKLLQQYGIKQSEAELGGEAGIAKSVKPEVLKKQLVEYELIIED